VHNGKIDLAAAEVGQGARQFAQHARDPAALHAALSSRALSVDLKRRRVTNHRITVQIEILAAVIKHCPLG
jgi:hypothetical protein